MSKQRHNFFPFKMATWLPACYRTYLRMQRTSTLMEGDEMCDFRIYSVSQPGMG